MSVDPERVAGWRRRVEQLEEELADAALEALRDELERVAGDGPPSGGRARPRPGRPRLEQLLSRSRHALARADALLSEVEELARQGEGGTGASPAPLGPEESG